MTRKQFLIVLVVLVLLAGAGAWVKWSDSAQWQAGSNLVGTPLAPNLKVADVASIHLTNGRDVTTLKRTETGWVIPERSDFPADVERIRQVMLKLTELKIAQAEPLADALRARFALVEPKGPDTKDAGTVMEMKDAQGKVLAKVMLGRIITKKQEQQTPQGKMVERDVPTGRWVIGAKGDAVALVPDALEAVDAKAASWVNKDLIRVERAKTVVSTTADGKPRWSYTRDGDSLTWRFIGSSDKIDLQKAQDVINTMAYLQLVDIADPAKVDFSKGIKTRIDTLDGYGYDIAVGEKTADDLYPIRFSVFGSFTTKREVPKNESAEDKVKNEKAWEDTLKAVADKLEREKKLGSFVFLVNKTAVEPMLRERAEFLPPRPEPARDAKKDAKK